MDINTWRARIGTFPNGGFKIGAIRGAMNASTAKSLILCVIVLSTILKLANDVELNPGPPKQNPQPESASNMRQTRLSELKGGNSYTNEDIMRTHQDMRTEMSNNTKTLKEEFTRFKTEINMKFEDLKSNYDTKIAELSVENEKLNGKVGELEEKLERFSRKRNVILRDSENSVTGKSFTEQAKYVRTFLENRLKISKETCDKMTLETVKKIGDNVVLVQFAKFGDKIDVLRASKVLKDVKEASVSEDFSQAVREKRRLLIPQMISARDEGKKAFLRGDKLIIDGDTYTCDGSGTGELVAVHTEK